MKAIQLSLSSQKPNTKLYVISRREASRLFFFFLNAVPQTAIATCMKAAQEELTLCAGFRNLRRISHLAQLFFVRCWRLQSLFTHKHDGCKLRCQISPSCAHARSSEASCLCFNVEAQHNRVVGDGVPVERLASGAVIADARCNLSISSLLCSPSFLIILSAIYQTMKSERTKKIELVVSLHYGLCQVF